MIIRRLVHSSLARKFIKIDPFISRPFYRFSENSPIEIQDKKQLLNQTLKQLNMLKEPSIFMGEEEEIEQRKKKSLTQEEKLKLGLYIPKMPLNPRMGLESQLSYRKQLCENLYELQKSHLQAQVRILETQTNSEHFTIDKYINTVYKDIYARYLVNKGIGVEWKGRYASYGILNSASYSPSPLSLIKDFIKANMQEIQKVQSIAPYSYLTQSFIPTDLIEFAKHEINFKKLQERGSKVQILVFSQFLEKLINPHCLCLTPGSKMIILKRYFVEANPPKNLDQKEKVETQREKSLKYEYLITSLDIFNKHKEYFVSKKYEKHLIFQSDHLVDMKAEYSLKFQQGEFKNCANKLTITSQIQGYQRDAGIYIVNGSTSLTDYERVVEMKAQNSQIQKMANVLSSDGKIIISRPVSKSKETNLFKKSEEKVQQKEAVSLSIMDIEFEEKLLEIFKEKLHFEELYDVFEDQVYSNSKTKESLKFRLFDKYQIPIRPGSYKILEDHFSSKSQEMILHESKVKLPVIKKFHKPRQRRAHKKSIKQALKQRTEYMSLMESISSITNIPISGSTKGDLKMYLQIDQKGFITQVYETLPETQPKSHQRIQEITINSDFISAMSYLYNTEHSHSLSSVIIEPQTFTEQILPLCLHLTLYKTKQEPVKRGRKTSTAKNQDSLTKKLLESFKMIYLHPTLKPSQRDLDVHHFITGSLKISNKQDYGFGFEAIRLWVCRNSDYLGDRQLKEREVNQQLKNCAFIRKLYGELIPLVPKSQLSDTLNSIPFNQLNFLDRFMQEQIDAYILNMERFYSQIMIKEAYEYTLDFYKNIVEEIFVSTARHHIITYPNHTDNLSHGVTVRRLIGLLSVIAPLFPFSAYHISKTNIMKWPQIKNSDNFYKSLLEYSALIKIRTELRNKIEVNKFSHCEMVFPMSDTITYSQEDLRKFFGVDKISFVEPEFKEKKFGLKLRHNETLGGKSKISVHESKEHCIRCDPHSKQKEHLCHTCTDYLQENIGQQIEFYDKQYISLPEKSAVKETQIEKERI